MDGRLCNCMSLAMIRLWKDDYKRLSAMQYCLCPAGFKHGTVVKGVRALRCCFGPPPEPKTENCFSPISFAWFIRRITEV